MCTYQSKVVAKFSTKKNYKRPVGLNMFLKNKYSSSKNKYTFTILRHTLTQLAWLYFQQDLVAAVLNCKPVPIPYFLFNIDISGCSRGDYVH